MNFFKNYEFQAVNVGYRDINEAIIGLFDIFMLLKAVDQYNCKTRDG